MSFVVLIGVGLVVALGVAGALFFLTKSASSGSSSGIAVLRKEIDQRKQMLEQFGEIFATMVPIPAFREKVRALRSGQEALRAERGRITITQAELETVENRLRELEEIERELEASGLETKEELNILKKKEAELSGKNDALKAQISASSEQLDLLFKEVEMSSQLMEQVTAVKTELVQTEESIATLMLQIEIGNEQYFILKRRYDALDIEYAQLYEKFSEAEAIMNAEKKGGS